MTDPVTNHTITVTINGVDRSNLLLADSLYVRSSIANGTDVAEFILRDVSGNYTPADWDEVTIAVNGTTVFGGYIIQRDGDTLGAGNAKRAIWNIQCKDWSILLDRVIVNKQYKLTDDTAILSDLFDTYLSGEGFDTSTDVDNVRDDIDINLEEITLREALNDLAARANANWHIAPNKSLYWYAPASPESAAFNINTDSPNNSTTFNVLEQTLRKSVDASQIINRVRVIGAEARSTVTQNDSFAANGTDSVFGPLTKKPHSMWLVQYTIHSGGSDTSVSAYSSQIGIAPDDTLLVDGGNHTVIANLENRTIKITDVNGLIPKAGTNVNVRYFYTTPVETVRNDAASQSAFGRVFEQSIYNENLSSVAEAEAYADRILEEYAFGRETVRFDIARHGLLPGRVINIVSNVLGISGNYLIQEVQFRGVAVKEDQFMVVASVQCGKAINTLIEALRPGFSAGAGRIPARSTPGRISQIATDLGDIVAGRAMFTDGGTARFEWGEPHGATGIVIGLEDIEGNAYGANYIYEGGTVRAKMGRLTGLPSIGTISPQGWGIYTTNGYFSGRVVASDIVGGTVTAGTWNGGTISNGTITAAQIVGGTVTGISLVGQEIEGAQITGGTITSVLLQSSDIVGGTITGGLFTGGTVTTNAGTIGGFTIANNHLWSHGGTISTGSVVNSSNPGVYMGTAGLFGFGTLGMTFGLWTDPAKEPWFSSGTINNVVYEVYESGIIRTGSAVFTDGGVQMDNSGIFGVSPITGTGSLLLENGDRLLLEDGVRGIELYGLKFTLDAVTGRLYAEEAHIHGDIFARSGFFSGTVSASQVSGGTVTGAYISGGTITGVTVTGQTITGNDVVGGTITGVALSGNQITGGNITASTMTGGTITGGVFDGGNVNNGTISAATILGGTFSGGTMSGGTVSAARFNAGTVSGAQISGAQISGGTVTGGVLSGGTVTGSFISGGTVSGALITGGIVNAAGGTITLDSNGLRFSDAGGTVTNPSFTQWVKGGTVLASVASSHSPDALADVIYIERVGVQNSLGGKSFTYAAGTAPNLYSYVEQHPRGLGVNIGGTTYFRILNDPVVSGVTAVETRHLLPLSNATFNLGNTTQTWAALFLSSPNGSRWRVSVDNSGNLVTTAV